MWGSLPLVPTEADASWVRGQPAICLFAPLRWKSLGWVVRMAPGWTAKGPAQCVRPAAATLPRAPKWLHFEMPSEPPTLPPPMVNIRVLHKQFAMPRPVRAGGVDVPRWSTRVKTPFPAQAVRPVGVDLSVSPSTPHARIHPIGLVAPADGGRSTVREPTRLPARRPMQYEWTLLDRDNRAGQSPAPLELLGLVRSSVQSHAPSTILMHRPARRGTARSRGIYRCGSRIRSNPSKKNPENFLAAPVCRRTSTMIPSIRRLGSRCGSRSTTPSGLTAAPLNRKIRPRSLFCPRRAAPSGADFFWRARTQLPLRGFGQRRAGNLALEAGAGQQGHALDCLPPDCFYFERTRPCPPGKN